MISSMSPEAIELGTYVREALDADGGIEIFRQAMQRPASRSDRIESILNPLGLWDLDIRSGPLELEAAASACRAAGSVALPYPIAERLSRPAGSDALLLVGGGGRRRAAHADLALSWAAVEPQGGCLTVLRTDAKPFGNPLGYFVAELDVRPTQQESPADAARLIALQAWWLLGLLERALDRTRRHVQDREQFGHPLAHFQATRFTLADMSVAIHKLEELAKYTLWSLAREESGRAMLVDAVALRAAGLESAELVLRGTHQLHGAMGFCDESEVSLLSRASQSVRRLPFGAEQTYDLLARLVSVHGLDGPFAKVFPAG